MAVQKISKEKITSTANTGIWLQWKEMKSVYTIRKNNWQAPRPSKQSTRFREQWQCNMLELKPISTSEFPYIRYYNQL